MRPLMLHVLLPLTALAATAIPPDPARAAGTACPRPVIQAEKVEKVEKADKPAGLVETKEIRKLEAL